MKTANEVFKFPERASYELGRLLRSLPKYLHNEQLSDEQHLEIEAADLHAMNCTSTLLTGLQGLGRVMWCAARNEEFAIGEQSFGDVGLLVTEIALQLQFLEEFRQSITEHELRIANAKAAK